MRYLSSLIVSATLLAAAAPASAQLPADTLPLTVGQAVVRALEVGEEAALAREQMELAETQITQARSGAFPQLNASVRYDRALRSVFDIGAPAPQDPPPDGPPPIDIGELFGDLPFGQPNTWIASLSIGQAVYTGGRIQTALEIARLARSATLLNLGEVEAEVARDVREAYFQAVFAESLVAIAEEAYALADQQLRQVESLYRQGVAPEFEVLQARVERDNQEPQVIEARNARELAAVNLKRLVNIPQEQEVELITPLAVRVTEVDRAAVMEAALARPALRAAEEQVRIQEGTVRLAQAERMPTVSAFGNFSFQAFPEGLVPTGLPGGSQWREDWGIGFQVSIPVFEGFRTRGAIQESQSNVRQAELQQAQLREGVEMQVAAAFAEHESSRAQIEARRATVEQAQRGLSLAELRYENGLSTLIEVSNARLLLQQARLNEADALFSYLSALAALEYATGGQLQLVDPLLTPQ